MVFQLQSKLWGILNLKYDVRLFMAFLVLLPIPASALPASDNLKSNNYETALDAEVLKFFNNSCHVGLSIGHYKGGQARFFNYGYTNKQSQSLPNKNSIYEIGSISKTFTGLLVAAALVEKRIGLDDDFSKILGPDFGNLQKDGAAISLRNLALHTSGLPRDIPNSDDLFANPNFETLPFQLIEREKSFGKNEYLRALKSIILENKPGTESKYSNIGIKVIGFGLENIYSRSFQRLIRDYITIPLKMDKTALRLSWFQKRHLATGYGPNGKEMPNRLDNAGAAGGLFSTASDLLKFGIHNLNESDEIVAKSHELIGNFDKEVKTALIWDEYIENGKRKMWHSGGTYGFSSMLQIFPDENETLVTLANDSCMGTQGDMDDLITAIRKIQ